MLGYSFYDKDIDTCSEYIIQNIKKGKRKFVCVPVNVDVYIKSRSNKVLKNFIRRAKIVVADGMPIVFLSKILKRPLKRITGADLMPLLCSKCLDNDLKIFLLGGKESVNKKAKDIIIKKYGNIVAGRYSPPNGFENNSEELNKIINTINECKPDIIFVCLGAPKQEFWIKENLYKTNASFALCAGAAIDFIAKDKKRAPKIMQELGLEWLFRLYKEPKRLARRYLYEDMKFIKYFIKEILKRKPQEKRGDRLSIFYLLKKDFNATTRWDGRLFILIIRLRIYYCTYCKTPVIKHIMMIITHILYVTYVRVLCNSEVGKGADIGPGLKIVHPYNIFIGSTKIGKNFEVLHETCIGASRKKGKEGVPTIGDNVLVGVGAKVIGPITVGNNVKIGANSVVHENTPDNSKVYNICMVKEN